MSDPIRRSVRLAMWEVIPFAIMTGLTESFMVPYALAMGATAFQAGLLTSVRQLVLSLAQVKSAEGVHWAGSRKRLALWTSGIQGLLWIPTAFVAWLFGPWAVGALVVLFTLGMTANAFGTPAWGSLVSEYLAPDDRGRFFGRRNLLLGVGTTVAGLVAGLLLQSTESAPLRGFAILCLAAAVIRGVSWLMLRQLHDLPWEEPPEGRLSFVDFLRRAPQDNFVRFTLCMGAMSFGTFISSPYVAVYMLDDLKYNYVTYSVVIMSGNLIGNLMLPRWGKVGDRHGNWVVMRWTFLGVSVVPILWAMSGHPVWLAFLFLIGGFLVGRVESLRGELRVRRGSPRAANSRAGVFQCRQRNRDRGRHLGRRAPHRRASALRRRAFVDGALRDFLLLPIRGGLDLPLVREGSAGHRARGAAAGDL